MAKNTKPLNSSLKFIEQIKSIALSAMFSDDSLMDMLVLKGGNALNLIYQIASRASLDLDFSIETKINNEDKVLISQKIENTLIKNFRENNFEIFDYKFYERPKNLNDEKPDFWGGYRVEFKVIEKKFYNLYKDNINELRKWSNITSTFQSRIFSIDISKYEFIYTKVKKEFDGLTIYVYSPEMICLEKLRAICQQMPEYLIPIKGTYKGNTPRARDFYDIYLIQKKLKIDLLTDTNINLLKRIFEAKKVPCSLIDKIKNTKNFHKQDYQSLKDSIIPGEEIKEFDYYFDVVVEICSKITSLLENKSSTLLNN